MDIYAILSSKPHNSYYLNLYIKFILRCMRLNSVEIYKEAHHICPKAKTLFPEYKSFSKYPENKIMLSTKQHIIAHMILAKTFNHNGLRFAVKMMKSDSREIKINTELWKKK